MRRFRIVMVAACPFPANHGSAASIREMSDTLVDLGHEVHIVAYPFGQEDIRTRRATVHRTRPFRPEQNARVGPTFGKLLLDVELLWLLCRVIRREKIEVIHAHNYEGGLLGVAAKWFTRRPLLYNAVNLMSDELAGYKFIRPDWLARRVAALLDWFIPLFPDHITAVSPELKNWMVAHGTPAAKITYLPAGVEPELFEHARPEPLRELHHLGGKPVVMYTGVLNAFQRVDYLLRAFSVVVKSRPEAVLIILCPLRSPEQEREHREHAERLGLASQVVWIMSHTLEELPSYLALADVTVVPRPECPGHPVKLLNYMLAGKAIVCFAGAAKGVTDHHDALVVPDHDWEKMGCAILKLLGDPDLSCKLGANARRTVLEHFDWRILCRRLEAIYEQLTNAMPGNRTS